MVPPTWLGPALSPIVPHSPPRAAHGRTGAGHTAKLIVCWPLRQYLDFCGLGFDASRGELPPVFDIAFKQTRLTTSTVCARARLSGLPSNISNSTFKVAVHFRPIIAPQRFPVDPADNIPISRRGDHQPYPRAGLPAMLDQCAVLGR